MLTGVLTYLHNPNAVDPDDADEDSDVFSMPPVAEIRKIKNLFSDYKQVTTTQARS